MQALVHLISVILVLPNVGLAAAFLVFGHAIATRSLAGFFGVLLDTAAWLLPWGLLAILVALLVLLLGGLTVRFRLLASSCVAALAVGSAAVVFVVTSGHDSFSPGQLVFFLPALVFAFIGLWLADRERLRMRFAAGAGIMAP